MLANKIISDTHCCILVDLAIVIAGSQLPVTDKLDLLRICNVFALRVWEKHSVCLIGFDVQAFQGYEVKGAWNGGRGG